MRIAMARLAAVDNRLTTSISTGLKRQSARASGGQPELIQLDEKSPFRSSGIGVYRSGCALTIQLEEQHFKKGPLCNVSVNPRAARSVADLGQISQNRTIYG